MTTNPQYIVIKDQKIPIKIKNYKTAKNVKIFFKGNELIVTKPKRLLSKSLLIILKQNEKYIYEKYQKILSSGVKTVKQWKTGEEFYYKGKMLNIVRITNEKNKLEISIDESQLIIKVPDGIDETIIKPQIDKMIKKILKNNTLILLEEKIPYWSKITKLDYNIVKVRDATTRYGSCMPNKRNLYFSSRLIMLPENVVDAIIVHEFCHLVYKNHSKQFYTLVEKYIPNYSDIDKWLKSNGNLIMF